MYSAAQDVRLALVPGAVEANQETAANLSDAQLLDAISEADGVIDTYIKQWYTIPTSEQIIPDFDNPPAQITVTVAPQPVRGWSRSIAAYLATLTFMKHKDVGEDDPVRLRYNMVIDLLTAIRDQNSFLDPDVFPPVDDSITNQGVYVVNPYEGDLFAPSDFALAPEGASDPQVLWPYRRW